MTGPTFFATPAAWREWLDHHHESETELLVGLFKVASGTPSMTWPESVDQALCFGWIDGIRRRIDDVSYSIRFTPRRKGSIWSAVNIGRVAELTEHGLMTRAGLAALEARREERSSVYSYEQPGEPTLSDAHARRLRANVAAWEFFAAQPAWYRRTAIHWVTSAKRETTRERRIDTLIEDSASGRTLRHLTRYS